MSWAVAAAVGAVALWSTNALAAKAALASLDVLQVLFFQFASAALVFAAMGRRRARRAPSRATRPPKAATAIGVIGLTGTIFFQYLAFDLAPILEANVIAYSWPLAVAAWTAVAAWSPRSALGLALALLGFAGVALIFDGRGSLSFGAGGTLGYMAAVASAGCMAFYSISAARFTVPADRILVPATTIGALAALALCLIRGAEWPAPAAWLPAVYIGLGPMAAGFWLWTRAMAGDGAARLTPIGYATPLLSTALLVGSGESFTGRTLVGAALVLTCTLGVLAAERLAPARRRTGGPA